MGGAAQSATDRAHDALICAQLEAAPPPPKNWRAAHDLALMRAFLSGGGLTR